MSHRVIIIKSKKAAAELSVAHEEASPYDISVEYSPPHEATPEQIGAEVKRISRKIDQIESGADA